MNLKIALDQQLTINKWQRDAYWHLLGRWQETLRENKRLKEKLSKVENAYSELKCKNKIKTKKK